MATPAQRTNTWTLDEWYDQSVAGTTGGYQAFSTGGLWSWGDGFRGQLAQNNQTDYSSPKQVGTATDWTDIGSSYDNVGGATKSDGTLWMWGINGGGSLGQNNTTARSSPVQVAGTTWAAKTDEDLGSDRSKFHVGGNTLAIKTDGTLWAWGYNQNGELGQDNVDSYSSPIQVGSDTTWKYINNAENRVGAIKTDGTLWTWGKNTDGQLGINQPVNSHRSSPTQITGTTWRTVCCGRYYIQATKTNGTLWAWGYGGLGTLGQNDKTSRSSPVQVGSGTDWKQSIGCLDDNASALKSDGTLWVWGRNENGLFGIPSIVADAYRSSPVQVAGTTWRNVEALKVGAIGFKTDGTLWVWGKNTEGQLGLNTSTPGASNGLSSPTQLSGTTWKRIATTRDVLGYATKS